MTTVITPLASGSSGNCYLISDGKTILMLECGISISKVREFINISRINGCLISHEHQDHAKYIKDFIKYFPIYASKGTCAAPNFSDLGNYKYNLYTLDSAGCNIGSFYVIPFKTQHDAREPIGFYIHSTENDENILFATDTYYIQPLFYNLTYIMVECNYSKDILQYNIRNKKIDKAVANRLLKSHFELANVKKFLQANDLKNVRCIYLMHLSNGNSNAERFKKEIQSLTGIPVKIC